MTQQSTVSEISVHQDAQDRIVDQILLQSGGVGLGVILTLLGVIALAQWLGLREAIKGWLTKQEIEGEALKSLSGSFGAFVNEYRDSTSEIKESLKSIDESVRNTSTKKGRW